LKLTRIDIENFRGIRQLSVRLDETTVLIGENNSGKSSVLDALRTCLTRSLTRRGSNFGEYDYHLPTETSTPTDADPIRIVLYFKEREENEWPDGVVRALGAAVQVDAVDDLNTITLEVVSHFNETTSTFVSDWNFLDGANNRMTAAKDPKLPIALQRLAPVFYLAALRDSAQEFRPRSQFWGPFVRSAKIDDEVRKDLENALSALNQKVLDAHTAFDDVKERLKTATNLVPLASDDPVHIQALPGKVFDLLSKTQVMLATRSGARLPLDHHGEGTQSLAVMCLFDAFLRSRLTDDYDKAAEPLLALEEPEAHLHPSAIRSLGTLLQGFTGQRLIATHSGDLLASVPLKSVRRLTRTGGEVSVHQLRESTLSNDELNKVTYHVRTQRGHILFARCWLLVEGQSEFVLLPELARLRGTPLDLHGVACVEFRHFDIDPLIRLADDLGIRWFVLSDDDGQGQPDVTKARNRLNGRMEADHVHTLSAKNIEHFLWDHGYSTVYENAVSTGRRQLITEQLGTDAHKAQVIKWAEKSTSKPYLAIAVLTEIAGTNPPLVPAELDTVIQKALSLAEGAG